VAEQPQKRHLGYRFGYRFGYRLAVALLVLAGAVLVASVLLVRALALRRTHEPPTLPTATLPFPTVQTSTPTTRPTWTMTPAPTGTATATATATPTSTPTPTPTPTPRVTITEIRSLGRLETVQFFMQTVINLEEEPANVWEQILGTDKLLLVAGGEVVAGFDLSKIQPEDISVRGDHVTIVLPSPEILYSRVDNEETFVYERKSGLFRKPDPRFEGEARRLAEQAMVDRALKGEILRRAEANGRLQVDALLRSLGFSDIFIMVKAR
jgi:hypothetical protein